MTCFSLEVSKHFGLKKLKIGKIHKDSWIIPGLNYLALCQLFITSQLQINFISKNWFYSFYYFILSFAMHQSHQIVGCHATGTSSLLISFLNALLKSVTPSRKSDMNSSFRIISMKISITNKDIMTIYNKDTHFIIRKCDITRPLPKKSVSSSVNKALWSFLIILLDQKLIRNKF